MDELGRVFLSFVKEVECKSDNQAPTGFHSTVALDACVRTFQTTCEECGTLHQKLGSNKVFKYITRVIL